VDKFWTQDQHVKTRKNVHINMRLETLHELQLKEYIYNSKCPPQDSMHASPMSHHGPLQLLKDARADADSLTGIHNALVKCLFTVHRICIHDGV
jgi:hypothetical protein